VYVGDLTNFFPPTRAASGFRNVVWLTAALFLLGSATAAATFRGENGRIAFIRDGKLFTIKPNSTGLRLLTPGGADRSSPTWSADGRRIAFTRFMQRGSAVFVVHADGSKLRRVSSYTRGFLSAAEWRPGRRQVLYHDVRADEDPVVGGIKLAKADGSDERNLTGYGDLNANPDWSPTGRQIVFERDARGIPGGSGASGGEIWVMRADGSGAARLTDNDVLDEGPAWSPDGGRITFARTVPGGPNGDLGSDLWTMRPNGSGETQLTAITGFVEEPEWSPSGRRILFVRLRAGGSPNVDLFTIRSDGSDLQRIATMRTGGQLIDATWSPDSRRVLLRDPKGALRIARADGSHVRRLTRADGFTDWQAR
jgi:TolB protein